MLMNVKLKDCLKSLCNAGLPNGKVYEFLAQKVEKFEKKFKENEKRVKKI